jgi:hypothetical protein
MPEAGALGGESRLGADGSASLACYPGRVGCGAIPAPASRRVTDERKRVGTRAAAIYRQATCADAIRSWAELSRVNILAAIGGWSWQPRLLSDGR